MALSSEQLLGLINTHTSDELGVPVHRDLVAPLQELTRQAGYAGFALRLASGFRSFERQQYIWNAKAGGERPVLDANEHPLDLSRLSPVGQVRAIMRWSALPGTSRHHWGTDVDVYDAAALGPSQSLQLTLAETHSDGPFAPFHCWLSEYLCANPDGFYRPYCAARGERGVAPEPWHLSYRPLSCSCLEQLTVDRVAHQLSISDIALKQTVLDNLSELYDEFVCLSD